MKLTPLYDIIIIEKDVETERGGIIVPESMKDPAGTDTGKVLSCRPSYTNEHGVVRTTIDIRIGDKVLFARKHGIAIKGSKTQVAVRYENLLAVIEP